MYEIIFDQEGDFSAYHEAEKWCKKRGISYGFMCGPQPIGLKYGDHVIFKWRNLDKGDIAGLDGQMTGNFRYGPVTISIKMAVV